MNDQERAAMQQALEALEKVNWSAAQDWYEAFDDEMDALRDALAEPAQEPVAWMYPDDYAGILKHQSRAEVFQKAWCNPAVCVPLYTAPQPQRPPLTDEEIDEATAQERDALLDHIYEYGTAAEGVLERIRKLARAIERKVRGSEMSEKNDALRLADALTEAAGDYWQFHKSIGYGAAAELRRLSKVEAQRDALLAALKRALPHAEDSMARPELDIDILDARAAIKAVEEGE